MYRIVDESEWSPYQKDCAEILRGLCSMLKTDKGIIAQFTLVGSGARNMVTRNGDGPFDLDYNLEIIRAPEMYWKDLRKLKDTVRIYLDKASGSKCFSESQNSTVALTAILHFTDEPQVEFSFDVAIVKRNTKGTLCRLVNNKLYAFQGQYFWNEIRNSEDVKGKSDCIKEIGKWQEVRQRYVDLKNQYLFSPHDRSHKSFIVYIEAVNEIYYKYFN